MSTQRPTARGAEILRHRARWPTPGRGHWRVGVAGATLVFCALAGTGLGLAATGPPVAPPAWHPACAPDCPDRAGASAGGPVASAGNPVPAAPVPLTGPPSRVRIPALGVDSSLAVLGLDRAGQLIPPADYDRAGWYGGGPAPGDTGPAVIAGHIDSKAGPAVFARVPQLLPGDDVQVLRGGRWISFRVVSTSRYPKDRFPSQAVYGPTTGPELRLITCGGIFDRHAGHYQDNIIVYVVANQTGPLIPSSAAG